jgi:hypothetical protein
MDSIAERIEPVIASSPYGMLEHDARWIQTKMDDPSKTLEIFVREQGGRIKGYTSVFSHPSRLAYALGELSIFSLPVRRRVIWTTPLTPTGDTDSCSSGDSDLGEDFVVWMHQDLQKNEVLFLHEIRQACPLYKAMMDPRSRLRQLYHDVPYGPLYQHRFIDFDGTYDDYVAGLGAKTRADLSRTRRRFIDRTAGKFETRCFTTPEDVRTFVEDAAKVSAKTYQFNLLGAGLRDRQLLENQFAKAAKLSWFRSYVLYVDGAPVAFQVGYVYNKSFNAKDIGYDPAFAKLQAGIFLHTEIVSDLLSCPGEVTGWDFGNLDTIHKRRLSSRSEASGFFYLIPRGPRGAAISLSMKAINVLSAGLGRFLDRFKVRQKIKNFLRVMGAAR